MYIGFYPYAICFKKNLNILFLYLYKFEKNQISISKFGFRKIRFLCLNLNSISQKQFKQFAICVDFWSHIFVIQISYKEFIGIYGILLELKCLSFKSYNVCQNLLAVDWTVDRTRSQLTGPVDRCARDMHKRPAYTVDRL